jgi:hypothetical protein
LLQRMENDRKNSLLLPQMAGQIILVLLGNCFMENSIRGCCADLAKTVESFLCGGSVRRKVGGHVSKELGKIRCRYHALVNKSQHRSARARSRDN